MIADKKEETAEPVGAVVKIVDCYNNRPAIPAICFTSLHLNTLLHRFLHPFLLALTPKMLTPTRVNQVLVFA